MFEGIDIEKSSKTRDLVYKPDFKVWVEKNPEIMGKIRDGIKLLLNKHPFPINYDSIRKSPHTKINAFDTFLDKENNIEVNFIRVTLSSANFKVSVGSRMFFVKVQNQLQDSKWEWEGGVHEIRSAKEASERLKDLDYVELADYKMAYDYKDPEKQQKNNLKYLVSGWINYPTLEDYLEQSSLTEEEAESLSQKIKEIEDRLSDYWDFDLHNCFYDSKEGKIILFDLNKDLSR